MNHRSSGLTDFFVKNLPGIPEGKAAEGSNALKKEGIYSCDGLAEAVRHGDLNENGVLGNVLGPQAAKKLIRVLSPTSCPAAPAAPDSSYLYPKKASDVLVGGYQWYIDPDRLTRTTGGSFLCDGYCNRERREPLKIKLGRDLDKLQREHEALVKVTGRDGKKSGRVVWSHGLVNQLVTIASIGLPCYALVLENGGMNFREALGKMRFKRKEREGGCVRGCGQGSAEGNQGHQRSGVGLEGRQARGKPISLALALSTPTSDYR